MSWGRKWLCVIKGMKNCYVKPVFGIMKLTCRQIIEYAQPAYM